MQSAPSIPIAQDVVLVSSSSPSIVSNDDTLPEYNQYECGSGCRCRLYCLPCAIPLCLCIHTVDLLSFPFDQKLSHVPYCMADYFCFEDFCDGCTMEGVPLGLSPSEYKVIIRSKTFKKSEAFVVQYFVTEDPSIMPKVFRYAAQELIGKETRMHKIIGPSCNISNAAALALPALINALPMVNEVDLRDNKISDEGFIALVNTVLSRPRPFILAQNAIPATIIGRNYPEGMFNIILDGNKDISANCIAYACQLLESMQYPLFICLRDIFPTSPPEVRQAMVNLSQRNQNVRIFTNDLEYNAIYVAPYMQNQVGAQPMVVMAVPVVVGEMQRSNN